jgi:hypothetical protein
MPRRTEIGTVFNYKGQRYEVEDEYMYAKQNDWDGPLIAMLRLSSHCADCGREFSCSTIKSGFGKRPLNRRCERCHARGRPVTHIHPLAAAAPTSRYSQQAPARQASHASTHGAPPPVADAPPAPLATDTLVAMAAELGADLSGWRPTDRQTAG